MPNYLVFNCDASKLKTMIYGVDGNQFRPIAVDSSGMFLFSPLSIVTVTATNLDIRSLSSDQDSVFVVASNLDIRNLSGTQDSVQVSSQGFVEDTITTTVASGTTYLLTKNISQYSQNSFFIRNNGSSTINVTLQVAPVDIETYYVDNSSTQSVSASSNNITSTTVAMKFARLKVVASTNTNVVAFYNGRA
ncbi:hypothetical protein DP73_05660 [Desulfosporosinus sp. HMP52]|uniref:DUF6385 domain-containing protein n=1 Tax=Desulfosporosinus sp. HMP52 TaxID=1487923 RepID=UPI00051F9E9A|nr:DUF6385 domain-containing protein [Desulfosporosinus sp. HMP52]KGK90939.1 hypothetical protein DP73_05660 [Desulfosporosinus sp. HMP52]